MSETKELDTLPVLSEVSEERERARKKPTIASVRVSPGPYLALAGVVTFVAALLLRINYDAAALIMIAVAWLIIPVLALSDKIAFDGSSLRRQGPLASLLHLFFSYRKQLSIEDFETVAPRRIARGPRIGIDYAQEWIDKPWRFWIRDNPFVSKIR